MKRKKRIKEIEERIERYKDKKLNEGQVLQLLDDAIYLLDDLHRMTEEVFKGLVKKT